MKLFDQTHWYCCDRNLTVCGIDSSKWRIDINAPDPKCRICKILVEFPCKPGCYGPTAGVYTPYIIRLEEKSSSVLGALKGTTVKVRDALVSINLRLRGYL